MTAKSASSFIQHKVFAFRQGHVGIFQETENDEGKFLVTTVAGVHLGYFSAGDIIPAPKLLEKFPDDGIFERACIDLCLYFNFYCGFGQDGDTFSVTIDTEDEMGEHSRHSKTFYAKTEEEAYANAIQYIQSLVN